MERRKGKGRKGEGGERGKMGKWEKGGGGGGGRGKGEGYAEGYGESETNTRLHNIGLASPPPFGPSSTISPVHTFIESKICF